MLLDVRTEYINGINDARAKHKPTIGRYQTHANPMISKLIDIDTDISTESIEMIPQSIDEFIIIVFKMLAKQAAARNSTNHPNPLKNHILCYLF